MNELGKIEPVEPEEKVAEPEANKQEKVTEEDKPEAPKEMDEAPAASDVAEVGVSKEDVGVRENPWNYEAMVERWYGDGEKVVHQEGFKSPHESFEFAKEIASGNDIKEKLGNASAAEGKILDVLDTHLKVSQPLPENPLGDSYTKWFNEEYGEHPYTDSRESREEELGKESED